MKQRLPILLLSISVLAGCVDDRSPVSGENAQSALGAAPAEGAKAVPQLLAALGPRVVGNVLTQPSITDALAAAADRTRNAQEQATTCPREMVLVSGQYCPEVEHKCVRWLETEGRYAYFRCAEYARPAKCLTERRSMRYCIDRDEYVPPGETLPATRQSWTDAKRTCESLGKRVCRESEWNFACEGEELRPYPYGFVRDAEACNADRIDIYRTDGRLTDLREGPDGHPSCTSPFGVHHLSGNLEEWTTIDGSIPARPAMKGAYWQPSRNHCRAAQTAHDEFYNGDETGFRCCKDVD
jgi:hypothetical protein